MRLAMKATVRRNLLRKMSQQQSAQLTAALRETASDIKDTTKAILTVGTRSGRIYRRGGRVRQASAPGEPPARDTGKLAKSVHYRVTGKRVARVWLSAEYASFLEFGTSRMKPRPFLSVAADLHKSLFLRRVQDVFKGRPQDAA